MTDIRDRIKKVAYAIVNADGDDPEELMDDGRMLWNAYVPNAVAAILVIDAEIVYAVREAVNRRILSLEIENETLKRAIEVYQEALQEDLERK